MLRIQIIIWLPWILSLSNNVMEVGIAKKQPAFYVQYEIE